jgi:hypothetical protein
MTASSEIIDAWPSCPQCRSPRNATCLLCGASRDFFPAAYQQEGEPHGLRFCNTCDDVAELEYFRECHKCGHDFGDGYEPPKAPRQEDETRAWIVLYLMLAGAAALGTYFYFLLRR